MSGSKKKRMGSQRRSLNQHLEESPETSDTAKPPPDAQSKHRADAKDDLTLSPGKSQSEIPARNKKLSSRRVNKERVHFKDVTTEASHEPLEEVEDVAASAQSPHTIVVENERIEIPSGGPGAAECDLLLNRPPNADTSITEAISDMPKISDISDTNTETISDFILNDSHLPESISTEEGVLPEKNLTQQMPEILDATSLATGVTGESTGSVRLIEQDINRAGSHDHIEVNTGEERAGHIEKPVRQQSAETSLPTTKIKKLGSRRRLKDANIKKHTEVAMAVESITAQVSETSDFTIAHITQDDTQTTSEGQTLDVSQKIQSNEPVGELLVNIQDLEMEETKPNDFEKVVPSLDLSDPQSIAISSMDDTIAHQSVPHPNITINVEAVEKATKVETGDFSTQNILEPAVIVTNEDLASSGISATTLKGNVDSKDITDTLDSTEGIESVAKEFKGETLDISCLELPFKMEMGKSDSVTELCEPVTGDQIMESSTGALLYLDENDHSDLINASVDGINTAPVQLSASSESHTDEDKDNKSEEATNISENLSDYKNVTPIDQEESLLSLDNYMLVGNISGQIDDDKKDDAKLNESQFPDREDRDLNAPIISPNNILDNICDKTAVKEPSLKVHIDSKENVNIDLFDRDEGNKDSEEKSFKEQTGRSCGSEESDMLLLSDKETLTEPTDEQTVIHATTEEQLYLDDNQDQYIPNVNTHLEHVTALTDVYQMPSTNVKVAPKKLKENAAALTELGESRDKLPFGADNSENTSGGAYDTILSEKQPFTLRTDASPEEIKLPDEQIGDSKSSETQETDDTDASLVSPDLEVAIDVQDVATMHSQIIGNERKLGLSGHVEDAKKHEKSDEIVPPIIVTEATQIEPAFHEQGKISAMRENKDFSQLVYVEPEETIEETDKEASLSYEKDDIKVNTKEITQQGLPSLEVCNDFENSAVNKEIAETQGPINVYNLTSISDNQEMENSSSQQPKQEVHGEIIEPSEAVQLDNVTDVHEIAHQGPRRKLGSSRRMKARNPKSTSTNDNTTHESKDLIPSNDLPQELLDMNLASVATVERTNEGNTNSEIVKDSMLLLSDKLQSDEIITPITFTEETQMEEEFKEKGEMSAVHEDKGFSQIVDVELQKTVDEVDDGASLSNIQVNSIERSKDEQSEENRLKHDVEVAQLTLPNEEMNCAQRQDSPALPATNEWEYQPIQLDNNAVHDEVYGDACQQMEDNETIMGLPEEPISQNNSVQIPHLDNTAASLTSPHPEMPFSDEQLGDRKSSETQETDDTDASLVSPDLEVAFHVQDVEQALDTIPVEVHDAAVETLMKMDNKHLTSTEVTEDNVLRKNIPSQAEDDAIENLISEKPSVSFSEQEPATEAQNYDQSDKMQGPINVYSLTCISDNETYEEIENSSLTKPEVKGEIGEPSEAVKLGDVTEDNDIGRQGSRRKLGSSRRVKARNPESTSTNDDITHESKELIPSEDLSQELVSLNMASVSTVELANLEIVKDSTLLFPEKPQTVDTESSSQEKDIILEGSIREVTQKDVTLIEGVKEGVKEEAEADATCDINILQQNTRGGSEEVISEVKDTQSVLIAVEETHTNQGVKNSAILETIAESPINTETKRKKMGSTRRSQLNQKQGEERQPIDDGAVSEDTTAIDEKDIIAIVKESVESDVYTKQEDKCVTTASPAKDEQPNEDDAERKKVAAEDKEVLEAEDQLIKDINMAAPIQSLDSIICEEIQPSSPGKRRKMGSTRKNLTFKTSPPEEIVLPINVDRVVVSTSNANIESREQSGLLIPTVSVHEQPPDEETPLSPQSNQEKSRLESELETSSHPDTLAEEAAVARKRKMGSHRKPHTDQTTRQQQHSDERLLHPLEKPTAESTKQRQTSQVDERDSVLPTATVFNIKGDSRSVGQRTPYQLSHPSTNVRLAQQRNVSLAAGYDPNARKYEVVMIGDSSVGKTSFMQRAQSGRFSPDVPASIGMDSYKWTVAVDGIPVVLHLWDTAGQERFHSMTKQLFHRGQAFLLMYDISCRETFTAVTYWANCIKDGAGENVVILLIGNKCDSKERTVRREEGEILAQENGFNFIECSAASGENVVEALETVARLLNQKNQKVQNAARREEPLMLRKPEPRNKGCC